MATSLTVTMTQRLKWVFTNPLDLSTPVDSGEVDWSDSLSNGTGTDQANLIWHDSRILTATSETLDLTALPGGPWGSTLSFAAIKWLAICNTNPTTGKTLVVGNAATNQWSAFVKAATESVPVEPNGPFIWGSPTDAKIVDATHKNLKIDAGASTITYEIVIIGLTA